MDVNTDRKFTLQQLSSSDVQDYILSVINKEEYHIAELIRSIRQVGFIDKGDAIIVKRVPKTAKFLVIEGNRRTTAIKSLLEDRKNLNPTVGATLKRLRVKEFIYVPNREFSEEAVIDTLLGTIHINGQLPWGALERAYYICNSYMRELQKFSKNSEFKYLIDCSREVATFFNLTVKAVRKEICVYRVFEQLKANGYDVKPYHFTLIEMAVTDKGLSEHYFGLNKDSFHFSRQGLEHFNRLCVREKKQINNPKDFRAFARIYREGTEYEVALVEQGVEPIDSVRARMEQRLTKKFFRGRLEEIKDLIRSLAPSDYQGSLEEIRVILDIRELVNNKLMKIIKEKREKDKVEN